MKLSQETIIGLKRLCSTNLISNDDFRSILTDCSQVISAGEAVKKHYIKNSKLDAVKAAHASLVVLFTESARHDVDSFMLKCMLEDYKLAPERVNFIIETYIKCKVHTQQRLRLIGTHFPHIIDVHWKMDYTVRSSGSRNLLVPYFYVEFTTVTSFNTQKIVRFVCSIQNLEELLFLLKGAVRHVNKIGNILK